MVPRVRLEQGSVVIKFTHRYNHILTIYYITIIHILG